MNHIYLTIGQPGCGKSTFIKNFITTLAHPTVIISRDAIRFSLVKENEEYFSKEKEVFSEFVSQINTALKNNEDVIIDATHLNLKSREKILKKIKNKNIKISALYFQVPLETSLSQNENRKGTRAYVPPSVITRMYHSLEFPSLKEPINDIYIIEKGKIQKYLNRR